MADDSVYHLIQDLRYVTSGAAASHDELRELCRRALMTLSALNPDVPVDPQHNPVTEGARIVSLDGRYPSVQALLAAAAQDVDDKARSALLMVFEASGKFRARYYNLSTYQLSYIGAWCSHEALS